MNESNFPAAAKGEALCLKSPLSERSQRLQPLRDLTLHPYYGAKRRIRLFRTEYLIGKADHCQIRIDDPFVSPEHARLRLTPGGGGYFVDDLGSRNGVFLNGTRVQSAPLPAHGLIRVGRSNLSWVAEEESLDVGLNDCVVADPGMREALAQLRKVAASSLPVLILGETATGKEIFARLLHRWSARANGPYVAVNAALTGGTLAESELFGHRKGAFTGAENPRLGALRSAHHGTLFLDEVGDIPPMAQVKLLRALESGEVKALGSDQPERADFRLVCATSQDLQAGISKGDFRLDLYYRLAGFVVKIPPLRERPKDILGIATKFLRDRGLELDGEAEACLLSYRWPGNVRELRAALERAAVLVRGENGVRVLSQHFASLHAGPPLPEGASRPRTLEEVEQECIRASLERNGWARAQAAKELGIARSTLFEKMKKHRLRDRAWTAPQ